MDINIVHRGSEKRYVEKKQRNDQKIIASVKDVMDLKRGQLSRPKRVESCMVPVGPTYAHTANLALGASA